MRTGWDFIRVCAIGGIVFILGSPAVVAYHTVMDKVRSDRQMSRLPRRITTRSHVTVLEAQAPRPYDWAVDDV